MKLLRTASSDELASVAADLLSQQLAGNLRARGVCQLAKFGERFFEVKTEVRLSFATGWLHAGARGFARLHGAGWYFQVAFPSRAVTKLHRHQESALRPVTAGAYPG